MKNIKKVTIKSGNKENQKAEKKSRVFLRNLAVFLSAFIVLYIFFMLTFGNFAKDTSGATFYALSQGTYDQISEAYNEADKIKIVGGGGNVWENSGEYDVIAFVYDSADSAREVQNRLETEGLSLSLVKMEIKTTKLSAEETKFVNSLIDVSERIYDLMVALPDVATSTQTTLMLEEIKKTAITATVRGEVLAESEESKANIMLTGALVSDAFSQVTSSQSITTQSLSWLRSQILIYAYEFAEKY